MPFILSPAFAARHGSEGQPSIVGLRAAFLAFLAPLVVLAAVLWMVFPFASPGSPGVLVYVLVAVGPLTLVSIPWATGRLLDYCGPPDELAGAYATMLFINIAVVESAGVLGLVAAFLAEVIWPYLVGMTIVLVGFAVMAPTRARIRSFDERLSTRGCEHSLRTGLLASSETSVG